MSIKTEISIGEFLDKLTILQIKRDRIKDVSKLANINAELEALQKLWRQSAHAAADIGMELQALRSINEKLWDIEDDIRGKEARGEFDDKFIELARAVYTTNDERSALKRALNQKLKSGLIEEKSYKDC